MYDIFNSIKNTSGSNAKIEIVRKNADNSVFKHFLTFLYDDLITTGLSKRKINKKIELKGATTVRGFETPMDMMDFLDEFNTGTDKIILYVQVYLRDIKNEDHKQFMSEVLTKSYKCGITANSVNKAIPKHIKQFKVQLAHSYDKYADKIDGHFALTTKLDGHRTLAEVNDDGEIIFRTRKGHIINGLVELEDEMRLLRPLIPKGGVMFDGEITVSDNSVPIEDVFQATSRVIRKDGEKTGLTFHVFDWLPLDEFWDGVSKDDYHKRRAELFRQIGDNIKSKRFSRIKLVDLLYVGDNHNQISKCMKKAVAKGEEGIMLNMLDEPYRCTRTRGLLKVKKFFDADLEVTGVFEGEGKYSGMLGGIYVDYKGNQVGVGTGFTDSDREYFWNNQDEIVGKVVEITYFEETTNQKDDGLSLRFPVYISRRDDKTVDDVNIG